MRFSSVLSAGDWVEVLSKEEILATLDETGSLDGLPFMPEMAQYCGMKFRVSKRAHKTCDPPNGLAGRRMLGTVHLEGLRCDGAAHGGCQAKCLLFWKEQWLRSSKHLAAIPQGAKCSEQTMHQVAVTVDDSGEPRYSCQSTQIHSASMPLKWWDIRQYVEDVASGNIRVLQLVAAVWFFLCNQVASAGIGFGTMARRIYEITCGTPYPCKVGNIPTGSKTPSAKLDLQPGEYVRVRKYEDILKTVNDSGNNRGMSFDPEMVPYCGKTYRVLSRVTQIINEKTGKMQHLSNDCIMLEGVVCNACYSKYRHFCPRNIYPYWREIWLERIGQGEVESEIGSVLVQIGEREEEELAPEHRI